jgi:hypothetical protein
MGWGMQTMTTSTVNIGTLVIDLYDPARKMLVWRGQGTKTLDPVTLKRTRSGFKNQSRRL